MNDLSYVAALGAGLTKGGLSVAETAEAISQIRVMQAEYWERAVQKIVEGRELDIQILIGRFSDDPNLISADVYCGLNAAALLQIRCPDGEGAEYSAVLISVGPDVIRAFGQVPTTIQ